MALTSELIKGNAATAGLTDEQVNAIVELSKNDETTVIGQKTGEIYGGLDADILAASGMAKNGTEKTYDYAKRVIGEIKAKADSVGQLTTQIADLNKEKTRLEKVIADGGGDAETKKQLKQAQADLTSVTKNYTELKQKFDEEKVNHEKELFGIRIDSELDKAAGAIKFKADLPETVQRVLMNNAKTVVRGMQPEYIDNGQGGKVLAFKGADGAIMRNPENNLNPFTASELVMRELKNMGVLEMGKHTTGAGSEGGQGGQGGQGGNYNVDLSAATSQSDADDRITKALLAQGLTMSSDAFFDAKSKIWADNKEFITKLPVH